MMKFKASTRRDLPRIAEKLRLDADQVTDMLAVSAVLPFRVNDYVIENLIDPERVTGCMPGASLTGVDGDSFTGQIKVKIGPVALVYNQAAHSCTLLLQGVQNI